MKKSKSDIENKFSKKQLVSCKKYLKYIDILNTLLKDDTSYTFEEVDEVLNKFMKGRV